MNKFLPLLLCLLLSIFTLARATKPTHTTISNTKATHNEPSGQEAEAKRLFDDSNTDEAADSDDNDSTEVPSNADGENTNDEGNGDALGDQNTGDSDQGMMETMTLAVMEANKAKGVFVPSSTTSPRHLASGRSVQYF